VLRGIISDNCNVGRLDGGDGGCNVPHLGFGARYVLRGIKNK